MWISWVAEALRSVNVSHVYVVYIFMKYNAAEGVGGGFSIIGLRM